MEGFLYTPVHPTLFATLRIIRSCVIFSYVGYDEIALTFTCSHVIRLGMSPTHYTILYVAYKFRFTQIIEVKITTIYYSFTSVIINSFERGKVFLAVLSSTVPPLSFFSAFRGDSIDGRSELDSLVGAERFFFVTLTGSRPVNFSRMFA